MQAVRRRCGIRNWRARVGLVGLGRASLAAASDGPVRGEGDGWTGRACGTVEQDHFGTSRKNA